MPVKKIPGYTIFLDQQLGKGSYGTVYKGKKQQTQEDCAIKLIKKQKISKSTYLERALFSEINIMAKLHSKNIVSFLGVLQSANNYYIAQQLCQNDLQKELKNKKRFSETQAIKILGQICSGFLELVKQGVVHRDLKPSNLLIKDGQIKICDFGFAKCNIHKNMKNQSNVGTPLYKPIQIFKGIPYTSKCDIWSMGIIFYQLLHGKTPFNTKNIKSIQDLVQQIQKNEFKMDPNLSPNTQDFLIKTLQKYQSKRLCWDQVYQHPIFQKKFEKYLDHNKKRQDKYKSLLKGIQVLMVSEQMGIQDFWKSRDFKKRQSLNGKGFHKLLQSIDPNISTSQIQYVMERMDKNGSGTISLNDLRRQIGSHLSNRVPLSQILINACNQQQKTK